MRGTLEQRFWAKVDKDGPVCRTELGPCWMWTGHCMKPFGHGQIGVGGRGAGLMLAHRLSWQVHHSPPPTDMCVCHHCDNGSCVNPAHLFLATKAENNLDMARKNRSGRAILTPQSVVLIRHLRNTRHRPLAEIAERFGVSHSAVSAAASGHNWGWL